MSRPESPLLQVEDLTTRFGRFPSRRRFTAVDCAGFSVERATVFGLVGESGCGKTTLARTLLYLERPAQGRVVFDGAVLGALGRGELRRIRPRMQIVFQDPNGALNPKLRLRVSLGEGLSNLGIRGGERRRRIEEACAQVGMATSHLDRYPNELSGGQKQRLVIARALTMRPDFLVLDEPVSDLDVSVQAQIVNLLTDLRRSLDLTYLFISHDLNLVGYLCDVVAVMYSGRIVEIGRVDEILNEPLHAYTRVLFASSIRISRNEADEGPAEPVAVSKSFGGGRCAFSARCPIAASRCTTERPPFRWIRPDRGVACFEA